MATSPRTIVGSTLDSLTERLRAFVEDEMRRRYGDRWIEQARSALSRPLIRDNWDLGALISVIIGHWTLFQSPLRLVSKNLLFEVRETRNRWAHQEEFSAEDAYRALDTVERVARPFARDWAELVGQHKRALLQASSPATGDASQPARALTAGEETPRRTGDRFSSSERDSGFGLLEEAFRRVFGEARGPARSRTAGRWVSDGIAGVQWSASYNGEDCLATLAVNLEGMAYEGWPVARFIERELATPLLPSVVASLSAPEQLIVNVHRDCWQAAGRVRIVERDIPPTPISLSQVTPDDWKRILDQAQRCLDATRGFRGRGRTVVTLAGSRRRVERDVSPHLAFHVELWRHNRVSMEARLRVMREARQALEPLHAFVERQSRLEDHA